MDSPMNQPRSQRVHNASTRGLPGGLIARLPPDLTAVWWWTRSRLQSRRDCGDDRDRGDILQTVIITAALAAAAILIVAIIVAKAMSAANNIKTQ